MKNPTKSLIALLVTLGLVAAPLAASAVGTRTLAANNKLFGFDGLGSGTYGNLSQLNELDGGNTTIGTRGTFSPNGFPYQASFDATSGSIYWINSDFQNAIPNYLMKANTTTGISTLVGEFKDGATATPIDSMAIGPNGDAFAFSEGKFYSIDKATGALTLINASTGQTRFYSFAYNPADQNFWAISNDNDGGFYTVNVATGAVTLQLAIGSFPNLGAGTSAGAKRVYSIAFDQNGSVWGVNGNGDLFSSVVTGTNAADFVTGIQLVGAPGQTATNSIAISYPVSNGSNNGSGNSGGLANTGTDPSRIFNLTFGAFAFLLVGAGLLVVSRTRRS